MRDGGLCAWAEDDAGAHGASVVAGRSRKAAGARADSALGPWQPILRRRLSQTGRAVRHAGIDVAQGELLRQRADGEPLGQLEKRDDSSSKVRHTGQRRSDNQAVHRDLLQPSAAPLTPWLRIAGVVR